MKDARMKETSLSPMMGSGDQEIIQADLVKITLIFHESPHVCYFSTIASLLNLVYKHLGFATCFGLHFL